MKRTMMRANLYHAKVVYREIIHLVILTIFPQCAFIFGVTLSVKRIHLHSKTMIQHGISVEGFSFALVQTYNVDDSSKHVM